MLQISVAGLRRVLWLDSLSGFAIAASHLLLADQLSVWLGIPLPILHAAIVIVIGAASLAAWLASRAEPPRLGVRILAAGNFAWVAASVWLVWGTGLALTTYGVAWVLLQAMAVFVMAELEWTGVRQRRTMAAA